VLRRNILISLGRKVLPNNLLLRRALFLHFEKRTKSFRAMEEDAFPTFDVLEQRWTEEERAMRDYLARLSDDDLTDYVRYTTPEGEKREPLRRLTRSILAPYDQSHALGGRSLIDHNNLEEFVDPHTYDIEDNNDTGITFYSALAQETGGPVLEIACGTGRVSIPIARLGFAVTGLDIVPAMLELARSKSAGLPTRWVEADARAFELDEQFRLIYLTGNAFQAFLTRADQEALLDRVRAHLHHEGLFAFETRNPRWAGSSNNLSVYSPSDGVVLRSRNKITETPGHDLFANLETRDQEEDWRTYTDSSGREVRVSKTQAYDHVAQILHWTTYRRWREGEQEHTKITHIAVRYTFPQELETLLSYNGFTIIRQYGDWNLEPLTAASTSIISVCRATA
jgi:SAM-dependent methyltransferase